MTDLAFLPRSVREALHDEPVPDWRTPTLATLTDKRHRLAPGRVSGRMSLWCPRCQRESGFGTRMTLGVISAFMSASKHRWLTIAAMTLIVAGSQLRPATARAELHNITYRARVDALTTGSQATFVINGGQTTTTGLPTVPGNVFEANTVLPDPQQAGMRIVLHFPYSANVHCEIDVDDNVFVQVDQMVRPALGNSDPMNGALQCGAPLPG
jgi:hypothetical protein